MKNMTRFFTSTAVVAALAVSALAQNTQSQTTTSTTAAATTAAAPQDDKQCNELYTRFVDNRTKDQKAAFEAGKQYVQGCPNAEAQYVNYVKKFVDAYEKATRKIDLATQIDKDKNYAGAFATGKQILADDPEDVRTLLTLSYAGLMNATAGASSNASLTPEAINYTKRTIRLIESGKTPDSWAPFSGKDDALGWLHYTLGTLTLKSSPAEAASHFIKSAQAESTTKKDATTYYYLATAYQVGDYKRLSDEYKAKCESKELTDECKALLESVNQTVDRIIDAYARAVSYAKPDQATQKAAWTKELTQYYKFRNNDAETGLPELIQGIQAKPLMTPAPAGSPTSTTAAPAPASSGTPNATATTPQATTSTAPAATTTTTTPAATTTTTTTTTNRNPNASPATSNPNANPKPKP